MYVLQNPNPDEGERASVGDIARVSYVIRTPYCIRNKTQICAIFRWHHDELLCSSEVGCLEVLLLPFRHGTIRVRSALTATHSRAVLHRIRNMREATERRIYYRVQFLQ